jgi:hypothetical protein
VSVQYFDDDSTQRPHMKGYLFGKFGEKDTVQSAIPGKKKHLDKELRAVELQQNLEIKQDLKIQKNPKIRERPKIGEDSKTQKNVKEMKAGNKVIKTHVLDTVRQEKEVEFVRGETKTYTMSFTVNDTLVTHIKGFWLLTDNRDSTAQQHIYLSRFRVHKPRNTQPLLLLKPVEPVQYFQSLP